MMFLSLIPGMLSNRCYILLNDTVRCEREIYQSSKAWKDHKSFVDQEVSSYRLNSSAKVNWMSKLNSGPAD